MQSLRRTPWIALVLLGLMALLTTPRELLHHCEAHELAAADGSSVQVDETCAICQAVVGPVVAPAAPATATSQLVATRTFQELPEAAACTTERVRTPRGPPTLC